MHSVQDVSSRVTGRVSLVWISWGLGEQMKRLFREQNLWHIMHSRLLCMIAMIATLVVWAGVSGMAPLLLSLGGERHSMRS